MPNKVSRWKGYCFLLAMYVWVLDGLSGDWLLQLVLPSLAQTSGFTPGRLTCSVLGDLSSAINIIIFALCLRGGQSLVCLLLAKAMATHSSTLAWQILWMEESGRLQSTGLLGVGHDWATSLSLFTFMPWRRKWQPTPVFLPGESQGRGSLVGCRLWGCTESDTTEAT